MQFLSKVRSTLAVARWRLTAAVTGAFLALAAVPALAGATESASETKVKEVATQVSSEGVSIVLAILGALVALIALIIIVPKGIKMIKRFI
jgi:hypothetical protein